MPQLEDYINAATAAELMGVSKRTFRRYCDGHYGVTLRTALIGRRVVTTRKWVGRFIEEMTEKSNVAK